MAKYNPFAEKAGMKRIVEQQPPKEALYITKILQQQGFNLQLLGSERYVLSRLQALDDGDILKIREAFTKQRHTRFMKSFSYHLPFGTKDAYVKEIMAADLNKLANLTKICGFLMQTKIYLIWTRKQGSARFSFYDLWKNLRLNGACAQLELSFKTDKCTLHT